VLIVGIFLAFILLLYYINPHSTGWPVCWPLLLLHVMLLVRLLATVLNVLSFLFIHEISGAVTSLNSVKVLFAACLGISVF
jgi:hypothetical protein